MRSGDDLQYRYDFIELQDRCAVFFRRGDKTTAAPTIRVTRDGFGGFAEVFVRNRRVSMSSVADDRDANRVIVLEGSPLGTPVAKSFDSADDAEDFIVTRVRAHVLADSRERFERALADRVVSEDGKKAVSEVIEGKLAFLRALAKAYARTRITITARRFDDDDDVRR
jgi:hypothetical protein